jgi:transketolase
VAATRSAIGWPHAPFEIPEAIRAAWDAREAGKKAEKRWNSLLKKYTAQFPNEAAELQRRVAGSLPADFEARMAAFVEELNGRGETIATRKASQNVLEVLKPALPELIGGSADLTGSNLTMVKASRPVGPGTVAGNHIFYGVREFGMCAIMNGIALHGGLIPYGGTFLVFSDYARNALRMAALMKIRVVYVFTHDSIGLGEDGPTHQPVEHASTLRLIPNMDVWRPSDTVETAVAWAAALRRKDGPTALLLTRQNVPFSRHDAVTDIEKGAYILSDAPEARAVIIATGSEVPLALGAQKLLAEQGVPVRVVSMPSTSVFDRQGAAYRNSVLPRELPKVAVEAGVTDYWRKYVGLDGAVVGIDRFGESAPAGDLFKHFGFTAEHVAEAVRSIFG